MKCSIMLHFIWVFTICQSTSLGVSSIQRVIVSTLCIDARFLVVDLDVESSHSHLRMLSCHVSNTILKLDDC